MTAKEAIRIATSWIDGNVEGDSLEFEAAVETLIDRTERYEDLCDS